MKKKTGMTNLNKKNKLNISIIICAYKNTPILKLCLEAIKEKFSGNFKFEVLVIDIEANEKNRDLVLEDFSEFRYIPLKNNVGFAKALNYGIKKSGGFIILSLNPDIIIKKDSIEILYKYALKNKNLGILGPKLLNFNGSRQVSAFNFYTPLTIVYRRTFLGRSFFGKKSLKKFQVKVNDKKPNKIKGWLMGSAMMLRRDNLEKVGLMDERYFMYFEDVDWCRRFWESGFDIVYHPKAKMFHYHTKMSASKSIFSLIFNKMTFIHFLSGIKYFWKFKGWKVKKKTKKS
ncbi:MAG: glycosyltransferase [Candidatus Moranbacteria bacterium]|nr:glycosyltransferase [Candidatus Moranbacteria bacterium]